MNDPYSIQTYGYLEPLNKGEMTQKDYKTGQNDFEKYVQQFNLSTKATASGLR